MTEPGKERQRLAAHYADMADGELEEIADDEANSSDVAREVLAAEIAENESSASISRPSNLLGPNHPSRPKSLPFASI